MNRETKYQTIINALELELNSNKFKKNDPFYSESDIKRRYQVSSTTAVRVLNTLAEKKYITRIQGKGSFVSKFNINTYVKVTDLNPYDRNQEKIEILSVKHVLENKPEKFHCSKDVSLWFIERVRRIEDHAFQYSHSWYRENLIKPESVRDLSRIHSVYKMIARDAKINLFQKPFTQNYTLCNPPSRKVADYLHVKENDVLVHEERWVYEDGQTYEYTDSYQLPKYFGLHIVSSY
jgi:Transcriptional regulators